MRATIRAIPEGVYEAVDALDSDGVSAGEVLLRVRVEVRGGRAVVDFEGSAPQVAGPEEQQRGESTSRV